MDTIEDIKKLASCLDIENDNYSDSESVDSEELILDVEEVGLKNKGTNLVIRKAMKNNLKKQRVMNEVIKQLEAYLAKLVQIRKDYTERYFNNNKRPKVVIKKRLGAPYFKDEQFYPSPVNEDYLKKKENKHFIQVSFGSTVMWTAEDKYNLAIGVYTDICSKQLAKINKVIKSKHLDETSNEFEQLKKENYVFSNTHLIKSLISKWQLLSNNKSDETQSKDRAEENLIIKTVADWKESIDWLKISSQNLKGRHSDTECKAMWNCYLNPKTNKESWKESDNEQLLTIAEKYNYQNWEAIAEELNINKSAFQCCIHFQAKLCEKYNRDRWTPEEHDYLKKVIDCFIVGDYISWNKVCCYFKHRTKEQIIRHYNHCMIPQTKKGKFSVEEDVLLLTLMKLYNSSTKKAKEYFPNRTMDQLRLRMKTLRSDAVRKWTVEDDVKIIEHVAKHGSKKWSLLEMGKSADSTRHRYYMIRKWFQKHRSDSVADIPRRNKNFAKNQIKKRFKVIEYAVEELLNEIQKGSNINSVLNVEYIGKITSSSMPKTKKKKTETKSESKATTITDILLDFFRSSYKYVSRSKVEDNEEEITNTADRINVLLTLLRVNLTFPSLEEINYHPMLDSTDKLIMTDLISKDREKPYYKYNIPPTIESLIGLRGLLLHTHTLRAHAFGKYKGYATYVRSSHIPEYQRNQGLSYSKSQLHNSAASLDEETREIVIKERTVFYERLKVLFYWPLIIAKSKFEPPWPQNSTVKIEEQVVKKGRKRKVEKNYKVELMNKARIKKSKTSQNEEQDDSVEQNSE